MPGERNYWGPSPISSGEMRPFCPPREGGQPKAERRVRKLYYCSCFHGFNSLFNGFVNLEIRQKPGD